MNVLLVSMPVPKSMDNVGMHIMPPMALYTLGAVAKKEKHEVKILDPIVIKKILSGNEPKFTKFIESEIDGIDIIAISSNTLNWTSNKSLITLVRTLNSDIKIVLGGLHPSYFYEYIMRTNDVNYILREEGEYSFPALLNALESKEDLGRVCGLVYWKEGELIINDPRKLTKDEIQNVPLPLYDLLPNEQYSMMPIMTSRGCQYGCRFCSIPRKHDWVGFDENWVVNYIKEMTDKYLDKFLTRSVCLVASTHLAQYSTATNANQGYVGTPTTVMAK